MRNLCVGLDETKFSDVEVINDELVSAIIRLAEVSIPKAVRRGKRKSVSWWNGGCREAIKRGKKGF